MDDLLKAVAQIQQEQGQAALASLIWNRGSIPMSQRAKMLVYPDNQVLGTIGGGCLEAEILTTARQVLDSGEAHLTRYTMTEKQAGESGLNCGGTVRIYTELVHAGEDFYQEIVRLQAARLGCVLATRLDQGNKLLLYADGRQKGTLGEAHLDQEITAIVQNEGALGKARLVEAGLDQVYNGCQEKGKGLEVFIEPFVPPIVVYVFGGGHVGGQICRLAQQVGFEVIVVDDRPYFANKERHPEANKCLVLEMDTAFQCLEIDPYSYVIAATRGHEYDEVVIEHAIRTPARYIGMLGSERKKAILWRRIVERGGNAEALKRVFAPVGLNIGADTPEEIGVSVVAEMIKVRRNRAKVWKTKTAQATG
jgi:xanthine dehydrogenase accessory factor